MRGLKSKARETVRTFARARKEVKGVMKEVDQESQTRFRAALHGVDPSFFQPAPPLAPRALTHTTRHNRLPTVADVNMLNDHPLLPLCLQFLKHEARRLVPVHESRRCVDVARNIRGCEPIILAEDKEPHRLEMRRGHLMAKHSL